MARKVVRGALRNDGARARQRQRQRGEAVAAETTPTSRQLPNGPASRKGNKVTCHSSTDAGNAGRAETGLHRYTKKEPRATKALDTESRDGDKTYSPSDGPKRGRGTRCKIRLAHLSCFF